MRCKLCGGQTVKVIYDAPIRNGGLGRYTTENVQIFQCGSCGVIWHDEVIADINAYYESPAYRAEMNEGSEEEAFYRNHDRETLDKFRYTGTDIFRNKTVADIGCGAGAFLDFLKGVASNIVSVEPSEGFRSILTRKGFSVYRYAEEALPEWENKVDVVTSFDVIEHVSDPLQFMKSAFQMLRGGGGGHCWNSYRRPGSAWIAGEGI